jgi:hypothetical protein
MGPEKLKTMHKTYTVILALCSASKNKIRLSCHDFLKPWCDSPFCLLTQPEALFFVAVYNRHFAVPAAANITSASGSAQGFFLAAAGAILVKLV